MNYLVVAALLILLTSCDSSSFSGAPPSKPITEEKTAGQSDPSDGVKNTHHKGNSSEKDNDSRSLGDGDEADTNGDGGDSGSSGDGDEPKDDLGDVPGNAVTRGSFSAWTIPEDPVEGQDYRIVIEVKLPGDVPSSSYQKSDLSGHVSGTDFYQQPIGNSGWNGPGGGGFDDFGPYDPESFSMGDGRARLTVWVPGAAYLVKDTITIRSRLLDEQQRLEIVF